jgi:hypothetical protein
LKPPGISCAVQGAGKRRGTSVNCQEPNDYGDDKRRNRDLKEPLPPVLRAPPQDSLDPTQRPNTQALVDHLVKFFVASLVKRWGMAHALNLQQKGRPPKRAP